MSYIHGWLFNFCTTSTYKWCCYLCWSLLYSIFQMSNIVHRNIWVSVCVCVYECRSECVKEQWIKSMLSPARLFVFIVPELHFKCWKIMSQRCGKLNKLYDYVCRCKCGYCWKLSKPENATWIWFQNVNDPEKCQSW